MDSKNNKYARFLIRLLCYGIALYAIVLTSIYIYRINCEGNDEFDYSFRMEKVLMDIAQLNSKVPPKKNIGSIDKLGKELSRDSESGITRFYKSAFNSILKVYNSSVANYIDEKRLTNYKKKYKALNTAHEGFGLSFMHSIFKLERGNTNLPNPSKSYRIDLIKNEWESIQVIVTPFNESIEGARVEVIGLSGITDTVECFIGEYINCRPPEYKPSHVGWVADPLIPFHLEFLKKDVLSFNDDEYGFKVKKHESRSIWINFKTKKEVRAGNYPVQVRVITQKESVIKEIKLNLLDYCLPSTLHLKNAIRFDPNIYKQYFHLQTISEKKRKEIFQFYLNYHLNPCNLYDSGYPRVDEWQWCIARGANSFNLQYFGGFDKKEAKEIGVNLAKKFDYIRKNKLEKYGYIFVFDETGWQGYKGIRSVDSLLKIYGNCLPLACTIKPTNGIRESIGIWCPLLPIYDTLNKQRVIKPKDELWTYLCNYPLPPYMNLYTDKEAIEPRIYLWLVSKYNLIGILYWETIQWQSNYIYETPKNNPDLKKVIRLFEDPIKLDKLSKGIRWPEIEWNSYSYMKYNGDGMLVYPWKEGRLIPSIRLVNLRDGLEDNELLYQLKLVRQELSKRKEEVKKIDELLNSSYAMVRSSKDFENDPEKLMELRKKIISLLIEEKLKVKN